MADDHNKLTFNNLYEEMLAKYGDKYPEKDIACKLIYIYSTKVFVSSLVHCLHIMVST